MHATEASGFAEDIENEIQKIEWCDLMIWQFPTGSAAGGACCVGLSGTVIGSGA